MKMFKWLESRLIWGLLLILAGVVFLVQNLFHFELGGLFWTFAFGVAGLMFLSVFLGNRTYWWSLIPGFTLLGIGATILIGSYFPFLDRFLGGAFVLGGIGVAFLAVYLADQRNWWALIPAGVMLTLTLVVISDNLFIGLDSGWILFLGIGLTFVAIAALPGPTGQMKWAWIPAIISFVIGGIVLASSVNIFNYIWPLILIAGGLVLILRTFVFKSS